MKMFGIFDQNNNYKLLRYSNVPQEGRTYEVSSYPELPVTHTTVVEVCLPDIEYLNDNIGKYYNPDTNTFYN
jgi:hypothetical protein